MAMEKLAVTVQGSSLRNFERKHGRDGFLLFFPALESKSLRIQAMKQEKSHLRSHLLLSPLSPSI